MLEVRAVVGFGVALLAEGVDRNVTTLSPMVLIALVALLAEGVDRNLLPLTEGADVGLVALLAEGVDRNIAWADSKPKDIGSPSSRRAWIEIEDYKGVLPRFARRPPRGGRG